MTPTMQSCLVRGSCRPRCTASVRSATAKAATARESAVEAGLGRLAAAGALCSLSMMMFAGAPAALALTSFEANEYGEFDIGSAKQYGSATLDNRSFKGEDLRRSNFTSASMKNTDMSGVNLTGGYLVKAVCYRTNFHGANLSDVLFDRAVINQADLSDAILTRVVFTLSDLGEAKIDGADFTDALLDREDKEKLCKYASGTNPTTGANTRKSLGCGRGREFISSPSRYMSDDLARPEAKFAPGEFNAGNKRGAERAAALAAGQK